MTRFYAACSIFACMMCHATSTAEDGAPSNKVPELKALDHYAGFWDVEVTSTGQPFSKGKATAKWVLDGRFLQQTGELQARDGTTVLKYSSLMTYDLAKKVYRSWIFLSDGHAHESEASWNEKDQIMTSISRKDENGGFSTTTADFSKPGIEMWRIFYTDGTGNVVSEMSGKNTRRKK